jgi:uncharacterized protein (TIGR04255 family)
MSTAPFTLDLSESFPHLTRAPIVEALIHWRARAQKQLEADALSAALAERLPQYPIREPIQHLEMMATFSGGGDSSSVRQKRDWQGLRLKTEDGSYVVQFQRDGLTFRRSKNYERWEAFTKAAKDVWQAYVEIAAPVEIERLGVRFINHLPDATGETLSQYLREPPTCPSNLPLKEFVYQSSFSVPGHPFGIRVIKVMQPSMPDVQQSSGLFVDIDVFSTKAIPIEPAVLDDAFAQMRWLKNKVFFTLLTDTAAKSFT